MLWLPWGRYPEVIVLIILPAISKTASLEAPAAGVPYEIDVIEENGLGDGEPR